MGWWQLTKYLAKGSEKLLKGSPGARHICWRGADIKALAMSCCSPGLLPNLLRGLPETDQFGQATSTLKCHRPISCMEYQLRRQHAVGLDAMFSIQLQPAADGSLLSPSMTGSPHEPKLDDLIQDALSTLNLLRLKSSSNLGACPTVAGGSYRLLPGILTKGQGHLVYCGLSDALCINFEGANWRIRCVSLSQTRPLLFCIYRSSSGLSIHVAICTKPA